MADRPFSDLKAGRALVMAVPKVGHGLLQERLAGDNPVGTAAFQA